MVCGTADEALLTVLVIFRYEDVSFLVPENKFMGNLAHLAFW